MKKIFLVKKDPELPGSEDNWSIMGYPEFARFLETEEGQRRKNLFARLDASDEDDCIIFLECDPKTSAEIKNENNHSDYLRRMEDEWPRMMLSLDAPTQGVRDEEISMMETIADEETDTESGAMTGIFIRELPAALSELNPFELDLMASLYAAGMSIDGYAMLHGVTRWSIRQLHRSAIRKLRLHYRKKKLL